MNIIKFPNMFYMDGELFCLKLMTDSIMSKIRRDDLKGMIISKRDYILHLADRIKSYYQDVTNYSDMYEIYKLNKASIDLEYSNYKTAVEQLTEIISEAIKFDK